MSLYFCFVGVQFEPSCVFKSGSESPLYTFLLSYENAIPWLIMRLVRVFAPLRCALDVDNTGLFNFLTTVLPLSVD